MRRKIPSSTALLAFETAARHGSFSRAAEELALTEGAVSRQIARLEDALGVVLFERIGNRVRLSVIGARYAEQVREVLDRLERDSQCLMAQASDGGSLNIAVIPTFASRWLIPRLKRFQDRHPGITVHLAERADPFPLPASGFDAAIHFEHPAWTGMHCHALFQDVLIPVCHPTLLPGEASQAPLDSLPRLHKRSTPDAWRSYAREANIDLTNPAVGANYDLFAMLIEAALAGLGVALVPRQYVEDELAQGRLVAPWPAAKSFAKRYCLVLPESEDVQSGPMRAFADWLIGEVKSQQRSPLHNPR
jgi:DNA-binding transcriptional LysR family regulator